MWWYPGYIIKLIQVISWWREKKTLKSVRNRSWRSKHVSIFIFMCFFLTFSLKLHLGSTMRAPDNSWNFNAIPNSYTTSLQTFKRTQEKYRIKNFLLMPLISIMCWRSFSCKLQSCYDSQFIWTSICYYSPLN